jgi:predicted glycosyltransferase
VTIRPPATEAHYHNPEAEILLDAVFELLATIPQVKVILLPRNQKQEVALQRTHPELFACGKVRVPGAVVDGLNLVWHSDLVISGGGTMNREAAALGVPAYSIFRGHIGAVDRHLAATGRLVLLESVEDVKNKLIVKQRTHPTCGGLSALGALQAIVNHVITILGMRRQGMRA